MTPLTEKELIELGRQVSDTYESSLMRFGRPLTNLEMLALHAWRGSPIQVIIADCASFCKRLDEYLAEELLW